MRAAVVHSRLCVPVHARLRVFGAEEPENGTTFDLKADIIDCREPSESPGELMELDNGAGHDDPPSSASTTSADIPGRSTSRPAVSRTLMRNTCFERSSGV